MSKPNILIIDCSTGEQVVREMTDQEHNQHLIDLQIAAEAQAKAEAASTE